jgi:restriction system protein
MAIPDYESFMRSILEELSDGQVWYKRDITEKMADKFKLSEEERKATLESGTHVIGSRVHWATYYLFRAGLLERVERGKYKISATGKSALRSKETINSSFLEQFKSFKEWQKASRPRTEKPLSKPSAVKLETPEESVDSGYERLRRSLAHDLLEQVRGCSPRFFERLVVDLLLKMGYGGTFKEAGQVMGKSGDGGVDGLIKEDKLGLDVIYVQAKRWDGTVPAGAVRDFAGSLDYHGAKKGVFITTSSFTADARQFVAKIGEKKIILVDGLELAQLMIDHDVGVTTTATYAVKRIDSDYFEEEL